MFKRNGSQLGGGERFLAGSFAGACSQTIIYPMEVPQFAVKAILSLLSTLVFGLSNDLAVSVVEDSTGIA